MKELYIIGAGSVGAHIAYNLDEYIENAVIKGFFDDDTEKHQTKINGIPVIGKVADALTLKDANIILGIAFPKIKQSIYTHLSANKSLNFPTLISKSSWISKNVSIGQGSIIYPKTSINNGSELGDFVILNMNCAIGHESKIGDFSCLAPGVSLAGNTEILKACDIGIGVSTKQHIRIGDNSVIGGQAMVVNDIPSGSLAYGVPAKVTGKIN